MLLYVYARCFPDGYDTDTLYNSLDDAREGYSGDIAVLDALSLEFYHTLDKDNGIH